MARPYLIASHGIVARNLGISTVLNNAHPAWKFAVKEFIYHLPFDWIGTGEDIRMGAMASGIAKPHHQNCWGGMCNSALAAHALEYITPWVWAPPRDVKSHARPTKLMRRTSLL